MSEISWLAVALVLSGVMTLVQVSLLGSRGSDHAVHVFLAAVIRENGHRLFARVPRLLNEAHCSAYPLFLHWCLSFLTPAQIAGVARFLNLSANLAQIGALYVGLQGLGLGVIAGWAAVLFALTPQFFHATSARNYGISARVIGLFLLALLLYLAYGVQAGPAPALMFLAAVGVGYFIWGFSTFAQQTMLLLGLFMGLVYGTWVILAAAGVSVVVFIVLQRDYALSYLKYTARFIKSYATDLAGVFILRTRYSVWRDLIYDVWVRLLRAPLKGALYAYENSVLIVVFLNPFSLVGVWQAFQPAAHPFVAYCGQIALGGGVLFLATSFRATRFLGEPERYLEMVSPFAIVAAAAYFVDHGAAWVLLAGSVYYGVANLLQLASTVVLQGKVGSHLAVARQVAEVINRQFAGTEVRFCANNELYTKYLMVEPWSFARLWSADQSYGGAPPREAFFLYPLVRAAAFENVVREHRINACLLDKANFGQVFTNGAGTGPARMTILLDTDQVRLYRLDW